MSQETLPNPRTKVMRSSCFQKPKNQTQSYQHNYTKVLNPLTKYTSKKDSYQTRENQSTIHSQLNSRKGPNFGARKQKNQNLQNPSRELKLNNPHFQFYPGELNLSSDASFMEHSFRDSRQQIQQKISQQFNHSKSQIQDLVQMSPTKKRIRQDKKEAKREKLGLYQCDQIMVKPARPIQAVKVIDLAICPTKNVNNNLLTDRLTIENQPSEFKEKPLDLKQVYEPDKNQSQKGFMDSIEGSPVQNSISFNPQQFMSDSPSFLETISEQRKTIKSTKQPRHIPYKISQERSKSSKFKLFQKEQSLDTKSNSSYQSKASINLLSNSIEKRSTHKKQHTQKIPCSPFKKRNKIFANDKKYGLKLSRAIKYEAELSRLQGQLGVDVFHIILQDESLLRNCCS